MRCAVMRLVEVWTERKVLRSQGIAAVRSHLEKVKDTPPPIEESTQEDESMQGTKRKRGIHPIQDCQEEVEETARQRAELEQMSAQLVNDVRIADSFSRRQQHSDTWCVEEGE